MRMDTKSPTTSVKSREMIGVEQFSQRREVFDKYDTVFMPLPSPTSPTPTYREGEPIITSNQGKTTANFKRNTPGYSSMRESRNEERQFDFRPRKYSDNFTSELNQSDDVEYRYSMTERTRRLSKMRRDFLTSNLHEPTTESPFARSGLRASLPARSPPMRYKVENLNLYKFPFAEPYATPPPVRKITLDLGPSEVDGGKENQDPELRQKYQSLPNEDGKTKIDHQKLFEELVKRYSPQRKPVDWKLPPTRPRIVGSVPKSTSTIDSVDSDKKNLDDSLKITEDDVFEKKENGVESKDNQVEKVAPQAEVVLNGADIVNGKDEPKVSPSELEEIKDRVPELSSLELNNKRPSAELTIPALIEKMNEDGEHLVEHKNKNVKKVKRKRSFLDKLLGRKKEK